MGVGAGVVSYFGSGLVVVVFVLAAVLVAVLVAVFVAVFVVTGVVGVGVTGVGAGVFVLVVVGQPGRKISPPPPPAKHTQGSIRDLTRHSLSHRNSLLIIWTLTLVIFSWLIHQPFFHLIDPGEHPVDGPL